MAAWVVASWGKMDMQEERRTWIDVMRGWCVRQGRATELALRRQVLAPGTVWAPMYSFTKAAWDKPRLDIVAFTRASCLDIPLCRVTAVRMARTPIATELTRPVLPPGQRSWMQRVMFAMR
jgi:hypothetical protein